MCGVHQLPGPGVSRPDGRLCTKPQPSPRPTERATERPTTYRARPRLRRRRSAWLSFRGFARCLVPLRDPGAPAAITADRPRVGARRRASRQMNSEMPPSTINAPIAMMIAELPLKALPPPAVALVLTVGTAVV